MNRIESSCMRIFDQFRENPSVDSAKRCMTDLTETIGPGFHPDTPFSDYIDENWSPLFEVERSEYLDRALDEVMSILRYFEVDSYDVANEVQRRLLGLSAFLD